VRFVLLNKPFAVLPQFTSPDDRRCLRELVPIPGIYPAGRLDFDSEGLMILTDFGPWQARISQPDSPFHKRYLVQVEGDPADAALEPLRRGVLLRDGPARPAAAQRIAEPPGLWPRVPPIRVRKAVPTAWIQIDLQEGRNRQVRRMTAAIGHPTLRLIRWSIGPWSLDGLAPGQWRELPREQVDRALSAARPLRRRARRPRSASPARGPVRR